jgi:serine protease Do
MWLTIRSGGDEGKTVQAAGERFLLGRDEGCDLTLADDRVSRQHAFLRVYADGRAEIHDLGSANGVLVNGHLIATPVLLQGGEQIQLGDTVMTTSVTEPSSRPTVVGVVPADVAGSEGPSASTVERRKLRRSVRTIGAVAGVAVAGAVTVLVLVLTGVIGGGSERSVPEIVDAVRPSTVKVNTIVGGSPAGSGTGWVLDAEEGLIVTNGHVVNGGESFTISFDPTVSDEARPARLVGNAPCDDLALLKVSDTSGLVTLPQVANQTDVKEGETVVALGFPASASQRGNLTATRGVVSVVRTSFDFEGADVPQYPNVIQTDATINPGNSGGPLVNTEAQLVGVNSASLPELGGRRLQNQGYAIGIDRVKEVLPTLRSGKGIAWTGMGFDYPFQASDLTSLNLPETPGLIVASVLPGSTAARAGFGRRPVLVTAVNGTRISNTLPSYCAAVRGEDESGQSAVFTVYQPGATTPTEVRVPFQ